MAKTLERRLGAIREATAAAPRPRVLFVVGWRPIVIAAKGSFADELLGYAGATNAAPAGLTPYPTYDMEAILRLAPEVIIEVHYGASLQGLEIERERRVWDALPSVPAVRSGRIYLLTGDEFVVPGPRVVVAARRVGVGRDLVLAAGADGPGRVEDRAQVRCGTAGQYAG